jgi:hypothetical protein
MVPFPPCVSVFLSVNEIYGERDWAAQTSSIQNQDIVGNVTVLACGGKNTWMGTDRAYGYVYGYM